MAAAHAQDEKPTTRAEAILEERYEKAEHLEPEEPAPIEKQLNILTDHRVLERYTAGVGGFFPTLGGLPTGQGLSAGVRYDQQGAADGALDFRGVALGSLSGSYRFELGVSAPRISDGRVQLDFTAAHHNFSRLDFYGLGPDSELDDRTVYRFEDTTYDALARFRPFGPRVQFGVKGGLQQVNTGPGKRGGIPSIEQSFTDAQVPGLDRQTDFFRSGVFATLELRDDPHGPRAGTLLNGEWNIYRDLDLNQHDFQRFDLEVQHYIPFYNKRRVILLRGRTTMQFHDSDKTVPFYHKPWIGGPVELRGFRNYRFTDDNVLMLNAEYRWEAFSGLDMALFFDAGQVSPTHGFELDEMETAAGFGFRFNARNATFLRLDFGFSHEGARVWFRFGNPF
ncbi:MAG: BamA/TamA family outer membrane protein [Bryobacterales bacterium]